MSHLVLNRSEGEVLIFTVPPSETPTEIQVEAVRIGGHIVRLGCSAPREVTIVRAEVAEREVSKCEGCGAPSEGFDIEGVPLCHKCADE